LKLSNRVGINLYVYASMVVRIQL